MNLKRFSGIFCACLSMTGIDAQPRIDLVPFAGGFTAPVCITHAGDTRMFVVEQPGTIRIADSAGIVNPEPFLDITGRVKYGGEEGLLGLAFHPEYATNGYFYVNYTGVGDSSHISRFTVSASDSSVADPNSEFRLLTIYQPYQNHKGGDLIFGPNGYLYIGMGDGGYAGDPGNRAQDSLELLGKMLRIDVNNGSPYAIPPSNPFVGTPSARGEIWALGLRNPWRFSFDRQTGDLWIGDVGQDLYEEIDFQPAGDPGGENYGWRCYEGNAPYNLSGCPPPELMTFPVYAYPHDTSSGCCIVGGYVYRGLLFPNFKGNYLFADYCSDWIWMLHQVAGQWERMSLGRFQGNHFSTLGENKKGELFIAGLTTGIVYHITDAATGIAPGVPVPWASVVQDPSDGIVRVELLQHFPGNTELTLFDLAGRVVYRQVSGTNPAEIDTGGLPTGMYLLKISTGVRWMAVKVIRQ